MPLKSEPVIAPEILEQAKRSLMTDSLRKPTKCTVCGAETSLGAGEPQYEELFRGIAARHPARIAVRIGYDNALAHKVEAGADLFLMPSRYEPCGLNQIYSLKYGTVPVVRATGGLDDTIEGGTGFKFWNYSGSALMGALRAAREAFADAEGWRATMLAGMAKDFSWRVSAAEYARLYERLGLRI